MVGLRIAMFSDSALPILNGVSISVGALVTQLRNDGHSVHLFTARYPGYQDEDPNTYRFRAMETPFSKGYPCAYPPFYRMLRKFRRHSYDIVHTHTPFVLGMVGLRWAESHDLPMVSTYHTLYDRYAHYIKLLPRRYVRFRLAKHTNFYYNQMSHVITPSEASLRWLQRHSVTTPISIIPTGIPKFSAIDRPEARQALGFSPEHRVLLYVGRLAPEKNLLLLLEAISIAMGSDRSLRLCLVGDGPSRAECVDAVRRYRIGDKVRMVGFVPRHEVDNYYAAADLFVFSSITETQGLVVQEAMSYGLPAVVVGAGGVVDAVLDGITGRVVRNDPIEFACAVSQIMSDESLAARLSAGARKSVRNQGIAEMSASVVSVYQRVLERRGEGSDRISLSRV